MKILRLFLILFLGLGSLVNAQTSFDWIDSTFEVGQKRNIQLLQAYDGPCTVYPCYDYLDNKLTYDTLTSFLKNNPGISVSFIWHTSTAGSDEYNFHLSKKMANGLVEELIRLGIKKERVNAIGLGESCPIIKEVELQMMEESEVRFQADRKNKRIELIITTVPNKS